MSGIPVVIAANGLGMPVRPVTENAPTMTVSPNGFGAPIVISDLGAPFIVDGLIPPLWTPERLFSGGLAGYWPGGYAPLTGRLFQEPAGTTPANAPNNPVGLSRLLAGTVDASQAAALSKPTLYRWPETGRRNLLTQTETFPNPVWIPFATGVAISPAISASPDLDPNGGLGAGRVSLDCGNTSTTSNRSLFRQILPEAGNPVGGQLRSSVWLKAADEASVGKIVTAGIENASGDFYGVTLTATWTQYFFSNTRDAATATFALQTRGATSSSQAAVVDLAFPMVASGSVQQPYQRVGVAADVTQAGVPDLWHIYNDGGDSLSLVLPAGEYGSAHIAPDRSYNFGTVISDGSTSLTTLTNDRQIDCIYRIGAFTTQEQADILEYWEGVFPL